jgi:hypothetical protein
MESLDDPPTGGQLCPRHMARRSVRRAYPESEWILDDPPNPGHFYLLATREAGRFNGTVIMMLPISGPDD